jgi:cystathionine beta-lyase/cystathionine gamma-synthase
VSVWAAACSRCRHSPPLTSRSSLDMESQCVVFEGCPNDPHRPSSVPIYQTATFVQPSAEEYGSYDYSRSGNPTRTALEKHVAMLERAHAAFAFTSGMAALNSVTRLLQTGDELLVGSDIYGGMHRLVSRVTSVLGITVTKVDVTDLEALAEAISPKTKMVHFESPSNPLMQIADVRKVAEVCHARGVLVSLDASMMPPVLMQALPLGVDIVVHSATKFFGGHSDTMGGLVCVASEEIAKRIAFYQNAEGTGLSPFDCWLFLRGIKTMAIRVDKAQANAVAIASFLQRHPRVTQVNYAGLAPLKPSEQLALVRHKRACLAHSEAVKAKMLAEGIDLPHADQAALHIESAPLDGSSPAMDTPLLDGSPRGADLRLLESLQVDIDTLHPLMSEAEAERAYARQLEAYTIHHSQAQGGGSVLSFTTGSASLSRRIVDALRIFKITVSFGSCNSLVEMPCVLSHASIPENQREWLGRSGWRVVIT